MCVGTLPGLRSMNDCEAQNISELPYTPAQDIAIGTNAGEKGCLNASFVAHL